jgi:hypothetical protein
MGLIYEAPGCKIVTLLQIPPTDWASRIIIIIIIIHAYAVFLFSLI